MFTPFWLSFQTHKYFVPFLFLAQYTIACVGLLSGSTASFLTWEVARNIEFHMDIFNEKSENVLNRDNITKLIQHHNHIKKVDK